MSDITSSNKRYFKNYLRTNRNLFSSRFASYSIPRIKLLLNDYLNDIDDREDVRIVLFDSGDVVNLTASIFDGQYIYLPGLENDIIGLKNGNDSIVLGFDQNGSLYYYNFLLPLGTQINLDGKRFTVKGLGGALLSVTDIPPGQHMTL